MADAEMSIDTSSLRGSAFSDEVINAVRSTVALLPERYIPFTRAGQAVRIISAPPSHEAFRVYGGGRRVPAGTYWRDDQIYLNEEYAHSEDIPADYSYRFPAGSLPHAFVIAHELGHAIHGDQRYFPLFLRFQEQVWGISPSKVETFYTGVGGQIQKVGDPKLRATIAIDSWRDTSELPHERRHFERVFASPIMSPDATGPRPREGRKGECFNEFSG